MRPQLMVLVAGTAMLLYGFAAPVQNKGTSQAQRLFAKAKASDFLEDSSCAECHGAISKNFPGSPHAVILSDSKLPKDKQGCQACHGPGQLHQAEKDPEVLAFSKMSPKEASATCLRCHEQTMSQSHWKRTEHAQADLSCTSCHQIHPDTDPGLGLTAFKKDPRALGFVAKAEKKAMLKADEPILCGSCHPDSLAKFRADSHHPVPEGRMVCSDCHSAHPSKAHKAKHEAIKGACVSCHTEKAGPFVFEHDPVAGFSGNGCQECHQPHGTNNASMLKSFSRGLCAQCHTDKLMKNNQTLQAHYPGQTCWSAGCHVAVHGSNSDPTLRQK